MGHVAWNKPDLIWFWFWLIYPHGEEQPGNDSWRSVSANKFIPTTTCTQHTSYPHIKLSSDTHNNWLQFHFYIKIQWWHWVWVGYGTTVVNTRCLEYCIRVVLIRVGRGCWFTGFRRLLNLLKEHIVTCDWCAAMRPHNSDPATTTLAARATYCSRSLSWSFNI